MEVLEELVKKLLKDGIYECNDSIHNIPAEDVVHNISGMK